MRGAMSIVFEVVENLNTNKQSPRKCMGKVYSRVHLKFPHFKDKNKAMLYIF